MTDSPVRAGSALIVIDVQTGFDDPSLGRRNNPDAEANIGRLIEAWAAAGRPIVRVRDDDDTEGSPIARHAPGNVFKPVVANVTPALDIVKTTYSAFLGAPELHPWLQAAGVDQVVICGIKTNHCCETTARWASDLGYDVLFALDATHTHDVGGVTADEIAAVTALNLDGHFARVVRTADLVAAAR